MKLNDKLNYCRICQNRKTDYEKGIVCGLTDDKPTFESSCSSFEIDERNADRLIDNDAKIRKIVQEVFIEKIEKKSLLSGLRKKFFTNS